MAKGVGCLVAAVAGLLMLLVVGLFGLVGALAMNAEDVPIPPELEAAYRQAGARTGVSWAALAAWDAAANQFALPIPSLDEIYADKIRERLNEKRRRAEERCRDNPLDAGCPPEDPELTPQELQMLWRQAQAEWRGHLTRYLEGHAAQLGVGFEQDPEAVYGRFLRPADAGRAAELFEGYQLLDSLASDEDAILVVPVQPPGDWVPIDGFAWPALAPITSRFGMRVSPIDGVERLHAGIDLGVSTGTPIRASKAGTVTVAEWSDVYGLMVVIDHGDGYETLYAHNSALAVSAGTRVEQGQVVSLSGSTGWSTGPHLHFETHYQGAPVDPLLLLSERHGSD